MEFLEDISHGAADLFVFIVDHGDGALGSQMARDAIFKHPYLEQFVDSEFSVVVDARGVCKHISTFHDYRTLKALCAPGRGSLLTLLLSSPIGIYMMWTRGGSTNTDRSLGADFSALAIQRLASLTVGQIIRKCPPGIAQIGFDAFCEMIATLIDSGVRADSCPYTFRANAPDDAKAAPYDVQLRLGSHLIEPDRFMTFLNSLVILTHKRHKEKRKGYMRAGPRRPAPHPCEHWREDSLQGWRRFLKPICWDSFRITGVILFRIMPNGGSYCLLH